MNSQKTCPTLDLETGERRANNQMPRRFKLTGPQNSEAVDDSKLTTNGNRLHTQKTNSAILSDDDLGISTSSFKPRFPIVGTETKTSTLTSSSTTSKSFGSVKLSEVDGLPTTRVGRDGKFLGNYSHNFRNDEAKNRKDWWSPK